MYNCRSKFRFFHFEYPIPKSTKQVKFSAFVICLFRDLAVNRYWKNVEVDEFV